MARPGVNTNRYALPPLVPEETGAKAYVQMMAGQGRLLKPVAEAEVEPAPGLESTAGAVLEPDGATVLSGVLQSRRNKSVSIPMIGVNRVKKKRKALLAIDSLSTNNRTIREIIRASTSLHGKSTHATAQQLA